MNSFRSFLYKLARILGDINAVKKGRVGRRVGNVSPGARPEGRCESFSNSSAVFLMCKRGGMRRYGGIFLQQGCCKD